MSSDEVMPEPVESKVEHWGSYDLRGAKIGEAVVTEPVSRGAGRGVVWEVLCPCGAVQLRSTGQLTHARDIGAHPLCPKCLAERRVVLGYDRRDRRVEHFYWLIRRINPDLLDSPDKTRSLLSVLLTYRGLYGPTYEDFEEAAIRKEIYQALGAPPDTLDIVPEALPPWEGEADGLDWSNLYPMAPPRGYVLQCHDCKAQASRGWGCVRCIEFSCFSCVNDGKHGCGPASDQAIGGLDDGMTLEAVGNSLGDHAISRERVRQLINRALRKLHLTMKHRDGDAESKCEAARYAILSKLPNPAFEEALWAERARLEEEKKEKAREAARLVEARKLAQEAQRQWDSAMAAAAASDKMLESLWWHIRKKVALATLGGRADKLPWDLRHPPSKHVFDIGDSVVFAKNAEGLVSCVGCHRVVLHGTPEFLAHADGHCDFVFAPPAAISIQGMYFPWDHDRPLLLSLPESDLVCLPFWTHLSDLQYVLERAGLTCTGAKRVTDAARLLADVPAHVTVIADAWFTPQRRLRFTQVSKEWWW